MLTSATKEKQESDNAERPKNATRFTFFPWRRLGIASVPVALLTFYLTQVGPGLVPVPPGVKMAFPPLTHFLEDVSTWCGDNALIVVGVAAILLMAGVLFKISSGRYYLHLTVIASILLVVTYYSISAPIDRLLKAVEDEIPKDRRVPDYQRPPRD